MSDEVKHRGCFDCGTKEEAVLTSVPNYEKSMGEAVCSKCLAQRRGGAS